MLLTPTLEECQKLAKSIGLPDREAQKFFYFFESNGWKVGKNPMKSLRGAMMGWKLRFEDSRQNSAPRHHAYPQGL